MQVLKKVTVDYRDSRLVYEERIFELENKLKDLSKRTAISKEQTKMQQEQQPQISACSNSSNSSASGDSVKVSAQTL